MPFFLRLFTTDCRKFNAILQGSFACLDSENAGVKTASGPAGPVEQRLSWDGASWLASQLGL